MQSACVNSVDPLDGLVLATLQEANPAHIWRDRPSDKQEALPFLQLCQPSLANQLNPVHESTAGLWVPTGFQASPWVQRPARAQK